MLDFKLIDLDSQAEAVLRYVKGWTPEEVLNWLSLNGSITIVPISSSDSTHYMFRSKYGETGFLTFEVTTQARTI